MDWFIYSIGAVISFSLMAALYKLPAQKKQSNTATVFWMLIFSFIFALIFFNDYLFNVDARVLVFALLWGMGFSSLAAIQMHLLKKININALFPINTTFSLIISVIFGLVFLNESISLVQGLGIIIAIIALYLFLFQKGSIIYSKQLIYWIIIMVALAVFSMLVLKFAADTIDIKLLQIYQYLFASIVILIIFLISNHHSWKKNLFSGASQSGLYIAIPSFFGNWLFLIALNKGPFSLVASLHALYILGASVFAYLLFKEKLNKKKIALLAIAILAIILIRIG